MPSNSPSRRFATSLSTSPSRERDTSSVTTSSKVSNARVLYRDSQLRKCREGGGGQVVWDLMNGSYSGEATFKLHKGSSEIWVYLNAYYRPIRAEYRCGAGDGAGGDGGRAAMASSIADTGSVAIYGINFDTAKSDIKPDSEPAIDEIANCSPITPH